MKTLKKSLAIVLAALMALSVFAMAASAEAPEGYYVLHESDDGLEVGDYYAVGLLAEHMVNMRTNYPQYIIDFYYNPTTNTVAYTLTSGTYTTNPNELTDFYSALVRQHTNDVPYAVKVENIQHGDYYMTAESFSLAQWGDATEQHMETAEQRIHQMTDVTIYLPSENISYTYFSQPYTLTPNDGESYSKVRNAILLNHTVSDELTFDEEEHFYACTYEGCDYRVNAEAHVWVEGETVNATCTSDGAVYYSCACGAEKSDPIPGGHDFDDTIEANVTIVPATCLEVGKKIVKCSRCDETEETGINALGHDFDDTIEANVTIVPATCLEVGKKIVKCSRCDETEETGINALGHDWGEWTVTKEATETEKGEKTRTCQREGCDAVETKEIPEVVVKVNFFQKIVNFFKELFAKIKAFFQNIGK